MNKENTAEREREVAPVKARAKIAHYIVTKRGLPCSLVVVLRGQRAGVLLPQQGGVQAFQRRARANAAVKRTETIRRRLHESLIRDWLVEKQAQVRELLTPGEFVVVPTRSDAKK
jgi:hypothetical protein